MGLCFQKGTAVQCKEEKRVGDKAEKLCRGGCVLRKTSACAGLLIAEAIINCPLNTKTWSQHLQWWVVREWTFLISFMVVRIQLSHRMP